MLLDHGVVNTATIHTTPTGGPHLAKCALKLRNWSSTMRPRQREQVMIALLGVGRGTRLSGTKDSACHGQQQTHWRYLGRRPPVFKKRLAEFWRGGLDQAGRDAKRRRGKEEAVSGMFHSVWGRGSPQLSPLPRQHHLTLTDTSLRLDIPASTSAAL